MEAEAEALSRFSIESQTQPTTAKESEFLRTDNSAKDGYHAFAVESESMHCVCGIFIDSWIA